MLRNYYNNLTYIHVPRRTFNTLGIDIDAPNDAKILQRPLPFLLSLMCLLIWTMAFAGYIIKNRSDIDEISEPLVTFVPCVMAMTKMFLFLYRGRRFVKLINDFEDLAMLANASERRVWRAENERQKLYGTIYYICVWWTAIAATTFPLLIAFFVYLRSGTMVPTLPFKGLFPYDYAQPFYFVLTNVFAILFIKFVFNSYTGIDTLFCWYVHNVSAHFRILELKLQSIARDANLFEQSEIFQRHIARMVNYHNQTIRLMGEFNAVFEQIILAQVAITCFQLSFILYQWSNEPELSAYPFIILATLTIAMQLLLYCFGGEKLQNESDAVLNAIYMLLPWHRMSPDMQRLLILPLVRAQQTSVLSGIFFVADRKLLVLVVKTAFQFNALLYAVKEKRQKQ